jgi:hypothetical protein
MEVKQGHFNILTSLVDNFFTEFQILQSSSKLELDFFTNQIKFALCRILLLILLKKSVSFEPKFLFASFSRCDNEKLKILTIF